MKSRHVTLSLLLYLAIGCTDVSDESLTEVIAGDHRTESFRERDPHRHPREVLEFFGVQPDMVVVEIWPGRGWWTEILAPYLKEKGTFYAAGFSTTAKRTPQWRRDMQAELNEQWRLRPDLYGNMVVTGLSVPEDTEIAPPGSADLVLTFRNVHNWMKGEYAPGVFEAMFRALKPGGMLGVVEHRANEGTDIEQMVRSGYVTEGQVIDYADTAGFVLVERAEINANPADTKDYPAGVWSLPPSLRLKEQDREKYLAIGESDRMTLKFRKPDTR